MKDSTNKTPYGNIKTASDIGTHIRKERKLQQITQAELASLCGVGVRFVSELENGKATLELQKVLKVLSCIGLELKLKPRAW